MAYEQKRILDAPASPLPDARRFPWVCMAILASCVGLFFLDSRFSREMPGGFELQIGALYGPALAAGEWWRIFLTALEHGGLFHLAMNMSVLWTLGVSLESRIGSGRFLLLSIIGACGSATFVILFSPWSAPTVGASGMILSWAGAMLPLLRKEGRRALGMWLAQIAIISFLPGVSWQGHFGGFLFGLPVGLVLRRRSQSFRWVGPLITLVAAVIPFLALQLRLHSK